MIKTILICIAALLIFSCGGGGGGGGMVSFSENSSQFHNGGDVGGWGKGMSNDTSTLGGGGSQISSGKLLIGQTAALDVSTVDIDLVVNGTHYHINNVTATTTTDVLPEIKAGDTVSGTAVLHLTNGGTRPAELEVTSIGLENNLKFKVQYNYTAVALDGTTTSGIYYARDGINLASYMTSETSGWLCSNGTMHYGSRVTGVRGDITLTAQQNASAALSLNASTTDLYAETNSADTATITLASAVSGPFTVAVGDNTLLDCTGSSPWTVSIKDTAGSTSGLKVWFDDNTEVPVTITDTSTGRMGTVNFTLKNKYNYRLTLAAADSTSSSGYSSAWRVASAGESLSFSAAVALIDSTRIPVGRSILAFKNTATNTIYKETDFPLTFSSTNFTSRELILQAVLDFTISAKDATNVSWSGATEQTYSGKTGMLYTLEKYSNTTNKVFVSLSGYSDLANLNVASSSGASTYLNIGSVSASGSFSVSLTDAVTHNSIPATGYTYTITVTDSGTGAEKYIHIKVAQPGEYKYSLVYAKSDGTRVQIPGWQNVDFTPGTALRFGVAETISTLKMGNLDSSLTGLDAAMSITGWQSTRASFPPTYTTPFPNVAPADCESDGTITLIATTDYGSLLAAYRQDENSVATGDIVLKDGKVLDGNSTFALNHSSLYNSYWIGTVCVRSGNRKFVVAKNLTSNNSKSWWDRTGDISELMATISGTETSDSTATAPRYDATSALAFNPDSSGKDSARNLNLNYFPAFRFCADYGSSTSLPSGTDATYKSDWYLPSIAEAYELYQQGVVSNMWIVSSSQFNADNYWIMVGNEDKVITWSIIARDSRAYIYPCHEFTFVAP